MEQRHLPWISAAFALPVLLVLLSPARGSLAPQEARVAIPDAVRQALVRGDWEGALARLDAEQAADPERGDLWAYLRGVALDEAGRDEQALAVLEELERAYPTSPWVPKARFRRADVHQARREFAAAEAILGQAARALRGVERQGELARVYLRFADAASTPDPHRPDAGELDYARARELYARVLELGAPRELRERAHLGTAACFEAQQDWNGAARAYGAYLDELDPARQRPVPAGFVAGERILEARLGLGLALVKSGAKPEARRVLEDLARDLERALAAEPAGPRAGELSALLARARVEAVWTLPDDRESIRPKIAALERTLAAFPDSPQATPAAMAIARLWLELDQNERALAALEALARRPPPAGAEAAALATHEELTTRGRFLIGQVLLALARTDDAIAAFEDYCRRFPSGPDWSQAQQGIVDAKLSAGALALNDERFDDARAAWQRFLREHPLDPRAVDVQLGLAESWVTEALARRSRDEKAPVEELFRAAVAQWDAIVERYPRSAQASRALLRQGLVRETELGEIELALETYRRCDFGAEAGEARGRLALLVEPSLQVVTERTARAGEEAVVRLYTRNVERVELALYPLDLEAYFRKHLTHGDVHELDLDLIAPDRRIELPIEGYARYAPLERTIALPVEGPGVWAVAVTAGELRATTLVLRSDVDVLVKSSRREVFVFAQDMAEGKPAAGVRVLVAVPRPGTSALIEERTTDQDGVARVAHDELATAEDVRVLAVREGHCASSALSLAGLELGAGASSRAHLSTDRPVYRPGERVHWRAVVREAREAGFGFTSGETYRYEVRDAQGRPLRHGELALSEFGTLSGELDLAAAAGPGSYSLTLRGATLPPQTLPFQVERHELARAELSLEPEARVVQRGDEVAVVARARHLYGEPLIDAPLAVLLPDGRRLDLRTDERGEARFSFDTRDFAQEGELRYSATLTEENVSASDTVYVATRGFHAELRLERDLVLAGDSFGVTLETTDPAGAPVAQAMTLEVVRRVARPGGRFAEERVLERELATDEAGGTAGLTLALEKGGAHLLRVLGNDRFGNPVTAEKALFVSGDDDATKLRLLADQTGAVAGASIAMRLVNRAGAGLALVTFETDRVLDYRLVSLSEGETPLVFETREEHVPDVFVGAALMLGNELFTAEASLRVRRELTVRARPLREVVEPLGEAEVELVVTDGLGRPVRAELAFAAVDDALFQLYPDPSPELGAFLEEGARRHGALATSTSCAFRYEGVTQRIARDVLDEVQRLVELESWNARKLQLGEELLAGRAGLEMRVAGSSMQAGGDALAPAGEPDMFSESPFDQADFRFVLDKSAARPDRAQDTRHAFPGDTAYWTPSVVTDASGRATLRFTLPERATRWRLTARGVDAGNLVGEGRSTLVSRSRFFARLRLPASLVEGDQPRVGVELHDLTGAAGEGTAHLSLRVGQGADGSTLVGEVALSGGLVVHRFPALDPLLARDLSLELEVEARRGDEVLTASARELARVRPYGLELVDSASGPIGSGGARWLELEDDARGRRLELFVGPSLSATLVAEALDEGQHVERWGAGGPRETAALASDLIGVCALLEATRASGRSENPDHGRLVAQGQALAAELVARQRDDGTWGWIGREGDALPEALARATLALALAREVGLAPDEGALERAAQAVERAYRAAGARDDELRAELVHALAALGRADFAAANILHRNRRSLSPAALAHAALALVAMHRTPLAAELAELLEPSLAAGPGAALTCKVDGNRPWNRGSLEMIALATLAVQRALPGSPRRPELEAALAARAPWTEPRGRGLAIAALARALDGGDRSAERARVTVTVAGGEPWTIDLEGTSPGRTRVFELGDDAPRRVRLELALEGRGQPHFSARLSGFTRDLRPRAAQGVHLSPLTLSAPPPRYLGRDVPTGFSSLAEIEHTWRNERSEIPLGERALAEVDWWIEDAEAGDTLELAVPLPAGARLVEGSVQAGGLGASRVRDGVLSVSLPSQSGGSLRFELVGLEPGVYRRLPVTLASVYEPARRASTKGGSLTVLERGETTRDVYRPTPDELFHLGVAMAEAGDREGAREHLTRLMREFGDALRNERLAVAATHLLYLSIESGEAADIVRYFEIVREKRPELVVPFAEVLRVADAYRALDEHERAAWIFRAVLEETFGEDLKVVGTLEAQGEAAGALETLAELVRVYPDASSVVQAELALADRRLTLAPTAALDASLRKAGLDRARLVGQAIQGLERFLAVHPTDPLAPEAGLNLVGAVLELDDHARCAELAGELAAVYGRGKFQDSFPYAQAVARWYISDDAGATALLERIAEATYPDAEGTPRPSQNRDLALYILGQIRHARRDVEGAAAYYERVAEVFSDAREALAAFREERLGLDEVTGAKPGAGVDLVLRHKNLSEAELLVYKVDLMTLYLREKNLSHVTSVDLAGISPTLRRTVALGAAGALREQETTAHLDLPQPGAYLVIARGGALFASGLALVSDLELEVHEDPLSGRIRVQALDSGDGSYLRGVDGRIVGSGDGTVRSGETDPRGLFVTDGVRGTATVIARLAQPDTGGDRYAFYRGTTGLLVEEERSNELLLEGGGTEYFKNVLDLNREQQVLREAQLGYEMKRDRSGVQVDRVK